MLINYADPIKNPQSTSSHTRQSVEVILVDERESKVLSVTGYTWSLMNFNSANKPWRYTETPALYLQRKKIQLDKILQSIRQNKKLDFILLQEADILTSQRFMTNASDIHHYQQLQSEFAAQLNKLGWYFSTSDKDHKSFATLFNGRTLHPVANKLILDNAGFESEFKHAALHLPVVLVNLQLDADKEYCERVDEYQIKQIAANKFTVMGGDTAQCDLCGLVNTGKHLTQVTANNTQQRCSDCFLANPTQHSRLMIIERAAEAFVLDPSLNEYVIREFLPNVEYRKEYIHQGVIGRPYEQAGWGAHRASSNDHQSTTENVKAAVAEPAFQTHNDTLNNINSVSESQLTIYHTDTGDLAIQFPSNAMRDACLQTLGGTKQLPEALLGKYSRNESPFILPDENKIIFIAASGTDSRIEAIFPDRETAIKFNQLIFGDTDLSHYHRIRPAVIVRGQFAANKSIKININQQLDQIFKVHGTSDK